MAIDAYLRDPAGYRYDPVWLRELESVSHREYFTGFYFDSPHEQANTVTAPGYIREKAYLAAAVTDSDAEGRVTFLQRNKLTGGMKMELLTPGRPGIPFVGTDLRDADGNPIESAPHPMMAFSMHVPVPVKAGDIIRAGGED
jgi:putative protease